MNIADPVLDFSERTALVLRARWAAVEHIVDLLLKRGTISGREVRKALRNLS